jgi:cell wall-associated NlpC family hydrolase
LSAPLAVAWSVVDIWARPEEGPDEARLTQALLGCPVEIERTQGAWAFVRLPDYRGWVRREALAPRPPVGPTVLVVAEPRAALRPAAGGAAPAWAYMGTVLPVAAYDDGGPVVVLPGGGRAWLPPTAGWLAPARRPFPRRPPAAALGWAERLLGAPYRWGGCTVEGIDCSALVQLAFRLCGVWLPRDADQQWAALAEKVPRAALAAGDLVFFARDGAIVHVALALDGDRIVHALGEPPRGVCVESLRAGAADYNARLDALYHGARRVHAA